MEPDKTEDIKKKLKTMYQSIEDDMPYAQLGLEEQKHLIQYLTEIFVKEHKDVEDDDQIIKILKTYTKIYLYAFELGYSYVHLV